MTPDKILIYRPDTRLRDSFLTAVASLAREIVQFRWHIWINFKRDFTAMYRQTGLGVVWNIILPVVPVTVYLLLAKLRVFPTYEGMDPTVYITVGVTLWFLFSGAIRIPVGIVENQSAALAKTSYPLICAILAGFAQLCFDTLVRTALVLPVMFYFVGAPPAGALFFPILLIPALTFFAGLGLTLSILNTIYRDVSKVVTVMLSYGIFVSLVIFPLPAIGIVQTIITFNPFATYIDNLRYLLVFGHLGNQHVFWITSAIGAIAFFVGCKIFHVMEQRIKGFS